MINRLSAPDAETGLGPALQAPRDSSILRQRVAALTRTVDERDATIANLVAQLQRAKHDPLSSEAVTRSRALNCMFCEKRQNLEAKTEQLKNALTRVSRGEKLMSMGQLAAGIAHEINTPIQYVSDNVKFLEHGFATLCRALATQDPGDEDLAYVRESVPDAIRHSLDGITRIADIVRAMKSFSHPCDGTFAPVSLAEMITTAVTVSQSEWKYVAQMNVHVSDDIDTVSCIRGDVENVVLNLIVNAAHAISEKTRQGIGGERVITISTNRCGDEAEILVADTGIGIPDDVRKRVFEPFFTTKPVGVGTGQGLSLAREAIAERHGGSLFFESRIGEGSTFHVRLPIQRTGGE
jgi:two-component system NtrC family sensor kinase